MGEFDPEYKIDVHAEQGEEDDHSIHQRDQNNTREMHRLALELFEFAHAQMAVLALLATDHSYDTIDCPSAYRHPPAPIPLDGNGCSLARNKLH